MLCCAVQIGMHFMNPVPIMALVELAKGLHTSQQTFEACKGLAEYLGKQVATSQDRPVSERVTVYWDLMLAPSTLQIPAMFHP
jgi:3-hydroxyacyl-CoA dehydrogenase